MILIQLYLNGFMSFLSTLTIDKIANVVYTSESYFFGSIILKLIWSIYVALIKKRHCIVLITTKIV